MVHEGLLDGMQLPVLGKSLDGADIASGDVTDRQLTRGHRFVVDEHRAGTAEAFPASELGTGECQIGSQHPQKESILVDTQGHGFLVERKGDGFDHGEPFL
jgi:hypothetical protein